MGKRIIDQDYSFIAPNWERAFEPATTTTTTTTTTRTKTKTVT